MSNLKEFLESLSALVAEDAQDKCPHENDDFVAFEWSGGNYDDAYDLGIRAGEIYMAREVQALLDKFAENS